MLQNRFMPALLEMIRDLAMFIFAVLNFKPLQEMCLSRGRGDADERQGTETLTYATGY